jgi:apolipoprotein N-acyltransferase
MQLIYTLLSSVIFIASFPFNLSGYLAFISLVPWFVSLSQISEIKKTAASGALFGMIISLYFSLPLYQSISISSPDNIIRPVLLLLFTAIAPNLIMYCLFSILMRWIYDKPQHYHIFLPASLWILLDYLKELSSIMIPWGFAGYTQVFSPFIQLAEITGIHGISFLIIMINSIIAEIIMIILNEFHYGNKTEKIESSYVLTNKLTFILSNKSFFIHLFLFCVHYFPVIR